MALCLSNIDKENERLCEWDMDGTTGWKKKKKKMKDLLKGAKSNVNFEKREIKLKVWMSHFVE